MKPQFNYQELIDELKDEIRAGSLTKTEIIQVLRSDNTSNDGYYPIIDWYYNKETMELELTPDENDTKEDIKDIMLIRSQYLEDKPDLQDITVDVCLAEMFEQTSITPKKKSKKSRNPFFNK